MKKISLMVAMAAVIAGAALASTRAQAQTTPLEVWQPPQHEEADPSKRVPRSQPAPSTGGAPQSVAVSPQPYAPAAPAPARYEQDRGGFFLGVQGGKGWVNEDVDQSAAAVHAGYRWQAGAVTLVGIEAAVGKLDGTEHRGWRYSAFDYASVGVNARFNFGRSNPVYGLVRAGFWAAEEKDSGDGIEGGYFGLGLGVDFNRNFNMSLVYTNHVYFNDYYWSDGEFYYDANRADTLMLGAEFRF